ncbi:MAG: hypothetical protein HYV26_04730, partial [Candidatus Hydrogenedentes bacterium]|nr:hypothetical protein [Candidatus Hydrogenedentota bacterium]
AISAIAITDVYRRHLVKRRDERHYVLAARWVTAASALIMMSGAVLFLRFSNLTLLDTTTKLTALLWVGVLGLYLLGFLTKRGDGRSVAAGIVCTLLFTGYLVALEWKLVTKDGLMQLWGISEGLADWLSRPVHVYYAGIFGNIVMFLVAYSVATLFQRQTRNLENLTIWTRGAGLKEERQP